MFERASAMERHGIGIVALADDLLFPDAGHLLDGPVPGHDSLVFVHYEGGVGKKLDDVVQSAVGGLQLLFGLLAARDVFLRPLVEEDLSSGVLDHPRVDDRADGVAVFPLGPEFEVFHAARCVERPSELLSCCGIDVELGGDVGYAGDHVIRRVVTEHPCKGRIDAEEPPVGCALVDAFNGILEDVPGTSPRSP